MFLERDEGDKALNLIVYLSKYLVLVFVYKWLNILRRNV